MRRSPANRSPSTMVVALACAGALLLGLPAAGAGPPPVSVVDLHVDLSYRVNYKSRPFETGLGQFVERELTRGGVSGVVLPLYVPRDVSAEGPRSTDLEQSYATMYEELAKAKSYALPGCAEARGKVRTWFSFEGAAPLARDPRSVVRWVARGVRIFGLVHSYDNALATSSGGSSRRPKVGLTRAGRDLVGRIHAAGGLVDVSHASDTATEQIVSYAKMAGVPAVATHSNARAVTDHPRNLTDAQIRGIAETGGVVGVNFHSRFLVRRGRATIADVVRHIRHITRTAGIDHVAIGSDFEGGIRPPKGLSDVTGYPALARALAAAGYRPEEVRKILSGNALRVLCRSPARE